MVSWRVILTRCNTLLPLFVLNAEVLHFGFSHNWCPSALFHDTSRGTGLTHMMQYKLHPFHYTASRINMVPIVVKAIDMLVHEVHKLKISGSVRISSLIHQLTINNSDNTWHLRVSGCCSKRMSRLVRKPPRHVRFILVVLRLRSFLVRMNHSDQDPCKAELIMFNCVGFEQCAISCAEVWNFTSFFPPLGPYFL